VLEVADGVQRAGVIAAWVNDATGHGARRTGAKVTPVRLQPSSARIVEAHRQKKVQMSEKRGGSVPLVWGGGKWAGSCRPSDSGAVRSSSPRHKELCGDQIELVSRRIMATWIGHCIERGEQYTL